LKQLVIEEEKPMGVILEKCLSCIRRIARNVPASVCAAVGILDATLPVNLHKMAMVRRLAGGA
jgi:hypothetical protein